ncbi:MAG TPA: hypothetical protein VFK32_00555, partial [Tepidiformaceae bacterium]|nr:hypothetical protein [Tepidiformaceae bacterium]
MRLLTLWTSDHIPALPMPPGTSFERCDAPLKLARLARISSAEAEDRLEAGERAYIASGPRGVVAIAWTASTPGRASETSVALQIGDGDLLITLVRSYPPNADIEAGLIAAIVRDEAESSERFWYVDPAPESTDPSPAERAVFAAVPGVTLLNPGGAIVIPNPDDPRTTAAARL